jgi:hypothetical protein
MRGTRKKPMATSREDHAERAEEAGERKRAQNEAAFRDANEDIKAIIDGHGADLPTAPFVCECGDLACRRLINVPVRTYREVRKSPRRFFYDLVHDGQTDEETSTIEKHDRFLVVEKSGVAGEIAEARWAQAQGA